MQMTIHERLEAFWSGERPDRIPYTIYQNEWRHTRDDPAWEAMYQAGLGVTWHMSPFREETRDVESKTAVETRNGTEIRRQILKTSSGEIQQTWANGWHDEYLLKTAEDYRVMTEIVRNTTIIPQHEAVAAKTDEIRPYGILLLGIGRTPLQRILVDFAGLENFAYHLLDYEAEVMELYDALLEQFRQKTRITAKAPGRFVSNLENFTSDSLGPRRYEKYLLPVYEECFPVLRDAGKIVGCHYDGRTACCRELIAKSPMDLIESLTEPNEGDLTLAEARAAWPDKLFWCNIRVGDYELPPEKLRAKVLELVAQGSVGGRRLAFEVSEQYPANWRESMPVVLEALHETKK
jgi:hypothetical protein